MDFIWVLVFHPNGGMIVIITTGDFLCWLLLGNKSVAFYFFCGLKKHLLSEAAVKFILREERNLYLLISPVACLVHDQGTLQVYARCLLQ